MRKRKGSQAVHESETLISKLKPLNSIKEEEDDEEKANGQKGFFACYLLTSLCPRFKGHTYIGFTVHPRRRIRQHNGEIRCGAGRTKKRRPWEMVLCIYGFPTNVSALQFEWAWQHPMESLAVRQAAATFKSFSGVANKIKLAHTMLNLPNWKSLNITVNYFSSKYSHHSASCPTLPAHMKVQVRSMDELPCYAENYENLFEDEDGQDADEASESSGSLEETCRDATVNFPSEFCSRTDEISYEQPRDLPCLEIGCGRQSGSLETTSPIIISADNTNELGCQRGVLVTAVLADENKQSCTGQKHSTDAEVANNDRGKTQSSTGLQNVQVIDLLTPSPNCRVMSYNKKRKISSVPPVIIDLT